MCKRVVVDKELRILKKQEYCLTCHYVDVLCTCPDKFQCYFSLFGESKAVLDFDNIVYWKLKIKSSKKVPVHQKKLLVFIIGHRSKMIHDVFRNITHMGDSYIAIIMYNQDTSCLTLPPTHINTMNRTRIFKEVITASLENLQSFVSLATILKSLPRESSKSIITIPASPSGYLPNTYALSFEKMVEQSVCRLASPVVIGTSVENLLLGVGYSLVTICIDNVAWNTWVNSERDVILRSGKNNRLPVIHVDGQRVKHVVPEESDGLLVNTYIAQTVALHLKSLTGTINPQLFHQVLNSAGVKTEILDVSFFRDVVRNCL
jgi:hypothetical protein